MNSHEDAFTVSKLIKWAAEVNNWESVTDVLNSHTLLHLSLSLSSFFFFGLQYTTHHNSQNSKRETEDLIDRCMDLPPSK